MLTRTLAPHCETLLRLDVSENALQIAQRRSAITGNLRYQRGEVPREWPEGTFDLIVLSEVLYFLSASEIAAVSVRAHRALSGDGLCLLVNWTGENNLEVNGHQAVRLFTQAAPRGGGGIARNGLTYRIDRLKS